jgi:Flp pilus assembly pilin Flp
VAAILISRNAVVRLVHGSVYQARTGNLSLGVMQMGKIPNTARALARDDRGAAVAEYGMIITILTGLVVGLMSLGGNVNDSIRAVGSLLMSVLPGH